MAKGKFPNSMVRFKDTRLAGGITVQGVEMETDEEGFVEAPATFESSMEPHGFLKENGPAYHAWQKTQAPAPAKAKK